MNKKRAAIALVVIAGSAPVVWYGLLADGEMGGRIAGTFRALSLFDQTMVVFTAFVAKPLYMLMSLGLAWQLRQARAADLAALRWGLISFFIGEAFCAINYLVFQDRSILSEYLHNYGMVAAFGFIAFALLEGLDRRVLQYSDPQKRCAFAGICGECVKGQGGRCRLRQLFQLTSLAMGMAALIPLSSALREVSYNASIFGTLYHYTRLGVHQWFEVRYCPALAVGLFVAGFVIVQRSAEPQIPYLARVLVCAGIGATGFSLFRLFFGAAFESNLAWAASWEELTELLLMVVVAYVLWLFRQKLEVAARG